MLVLVLFFCVFCVSLFLFVCLLSGLFLFICVLLVCASVAGRLIVSVLALIRLVSVLCFSEPSVPGTKTSEQRDADERKWNEEQRHEDSMGAKENGTSEHGMGI